MWRISVVMAVCVALVACNDSGADSGAQLACRHFRDAANDYSDGILTMDELRGRLVDVDDDAQLSDEPGISSNARRMLAAATAGNESDLADAVTAFNAACESADA